MSKSKGFIYKIRIEPVNNGFILYIDKTNPTTVRISGKDYGDFSETFVFPTLAECISKINKLLEKQL